MVSSALQVTPMIMQHHAARDHARPTRECTLHKVAFVLIQCTCMCMCLCLCLWNAYYKAALSKQFSSSQSISGQLVVVLNVSATTIYTIYTRRAPHKLLKKWSIGQKVALKYTSTRFGDSTELSSTQLSLLSSWAQVSSSAHFDSASSAAIPPVYVYAFPSKISS